MPPAVLIIGQLPDPHIQAVLEKLYTLGASVAVFNRLVDERNTLGFSISDADKGGWLQLDGKRWDLEDFRSVWWRVKPYTVAEQLGETPSLPEAFAIREWRSVLESLPAFTPQANWINPRACELAAQHKPVQLDAAREAGLPIPPTLITNDAGQAIRFLESSQPAPSPDSGQDQPPPDHSGRENIYKPLSWYAEPPDKLLFTSLVGVEEIRKGEESLRLAPGIFQRRIPKAYELRITIVGGHIFTVRIASQASPSTALDWRRDQDKLEYSEIDLEEDVKRRLVHLHRRLGLVFGAYDMIVTPQGEPVFLEVNPIGQWLWLEQRLNLDISGALAQALVDRP